MNTMPEVLAAHPELAVALAAAQAGGEVVARYFHEGFTIRSKSTSNLVSDADIAAEHAVVEVIRRTFPEHAILGEEAHTADADSEHLWVIDPLDGTNNFAHHLPQFAVSVAYCRRGVPKAGVVLHPLRDEIYAAVRGGGAYLNGKRVPPIEPRPLNEVLIGLGFYYDRGALMEGTLLAIRDLFRAEIHGVRRMGAAALDLCCVGLGMFGAFFEYQLSPWDFAAAGLFVEEAGGRISTCRGQPLVLAKSSILASNGLIHDRVRAIVEPHLPAGHP